jgi:hypothetical protein
MKEPTKQEMTDKLYKHLESTIRSIVEESPDQLGTWLQQVLQLYKMTKKELRAKFATTFAVMDQPPVKAYRFPLTTVKPENVVLGDDPMLPIIEVANEAYGEDLIMSYYKCPKENFGDTLARFIAVELPEGLGLSDPPRPEDYEIAHKLMARAAKQLESVANALETKAAELRLGTELRKLAEKEKTDAEKT